MPVAPSAWPWSTEAVDASAATGVRILGGYEEMPFEKGAPRVCRKIIGTTFGAGPEDQANAKLMSAAPDLFRELQHLVRLMEPMEKAGSLSIPGLATLNGARDALARATMKG